MPHLTTRTDPDIKAAFSNRAKARGMTESELLRALVVAEIGNDLADEKPAESNQEKTDKVKLTILALLAESLKRNISAVRELVMASHFLLVSGFK